LKATYSEYAAGRMNMSREGQAMCFLRFKHTFTSNLSMTTLFEMLGLTLKNPLATFDCFSQKNQNGQDGHTIDRNEASAKESKFSLIKKTHSAH
jgi:hypothetical protein